MEAHVKKGVRQEYCLSTVIYNIFIKKAIREINGEGKLGLKIQETIIKTIWFAVDTVKLAKEEKGIKE